jgi:lysophospholipase L1-like esterase
MKKLALKLFLFFLPFVLAVGVELFFLPMDFFTFRAWEALVVKRFKHNLPGPFYPSMRLTKVEEGDLTHHTKFSVEKRVTWITDRYGYRNSPGTFARPTVVIIGDSNIVGSGLTQKSMLTEVLADRLNVGVYAFAPASVNSFFRERRFIENPPDVVIFAGVERTLTWLPELKESERRPSRFIENVRRNRTVQHLAVAADRIWKMNMLHFYRASVRRMGHTPPEPVIIHGAPNFFLQGATANEEVTKEQRQRAGRMIRTYMERFKGIGMRFIFLPIPNKESIYHEYLPGAGRPVFLEQLVSELNDQGVEAINTQKTFEDAFQRGVPLYLRDDTHWNAEAVQITAELVEAKIRQKKE